MDRSLTPLAIATRLAPPLVLIGLMATDVRLESLSWQPGRLWPTSRVIVLATVWVTAVVFTTAAIKTRRRLLGLSGRLILAGLAFGTVGSLFSETPLRSASIGVAFMIVVVAVTAVVRVAGWDAAVSALMAGLIVFCFVALLLGLLGADSAWETIVSPRRLRGTLAEPNSLGQLGGLLVVLSAGMWVERKIRWVPASASIALGLAVAAMSLTRTIAPAIALALFGVGLIRRPKPTLLFGTALAAAGIIGLVVVDNSAVTNALARGQPTEQLATLSSRFDLWEVSLDEIAEKPLIGHGFASGEARFNAALDDGRLAWIYSPSSHNLALEIAREIGVPGLILIGLGAVVGASLQGATRPGLLIYLALTAAMMPTSGLPGVIVVAWTLATVGRAEPDPNRGPRRGSPVDTSLTA